jgi:hypothetical protein
VLENSPLFYAPETNDHLERVSFSVLENTHINVLIVGPNVRTFWKLYPAILKVKEEACGE